MLFHMKTRVGLKYFADNYGCSHTDMDNPKPVIAGPKNAPPDSGRLLTATIDLGWLQTPRADGFGWMWMFLGARRWFSVTCSYSSYGEIGYFKFKRIRQLWGVFVVSSNNDAKVPLKQMVKFFG